MGIFRQFPYTNFHDINLDEIIKIMREMQDEWTATKAEWASYKDFIDNYFANLDVSEEVLQAIRTLASTGELNRIIDPTIASETASWLADHITQPTTPAIDTSLSVAGAGADAKVTGDEIRAIENNKMVLMSGNINNLGGEGNLNTRIKTINFLKLSDYLYVSCSGDYDMLAYVYDENLSFVGYMGGWVTRYVMGRIVRQYPTGVYARFVFRNNTTPNSDISSEVSTVYESTTWYKANTGENALISGTPLASGDDLDNITFFGNYYAASGAIASSLLNCPTTFSFTMTVSSGTGDDATYLRQNLITFRGDEYYRYKNGTSNPWSEWRSKSGSAPIMAYADRLLLKSLADDYLAIRANFVYNGVTTRNDYYNTAGAVENGKFKIDCSTFAQLLFMGRDANDFSDPLNYSNGITKAFNWGYYFDFALRDMAELQPDANNYYGFTDPLQNGDYSGSYSYNSYYSVNSTLPKKQVFNPFMYANDMAREMERKGYTIDISELQTGDLVFCKAPLRSPNNTFGDIAYKNITHVAMVYEVGSYYIDFVEVFGSSLNITRCGTNFLNEYDKTRAAYIYNNIVLCARHPHAWNVAGNVPNNISQI